MAGMSDANLAEEKARLRARLAETEAALADAQEAQRRLEGIIGELRRDKFGRTSEKLDADQFNLPLEDIEIAQGILEAAQEKARRVRKRNGEVGAQPAKRNGGRLSKHLPRIERVVEPESTLCPCGCGEMAKISDQTKLPSCKPQFPHTFNKGWWFHFVGIDGYYFVLGEEI